jgi:hypothetical protein
MKYMPFKQNRLLTLSEDGGQMSPSGHDRVMYSTLRKTYKWCMSSFLMNVFIRWWHVPIVSLVIYFLVLKEFLLLTVPPVHLSIFNVNKIVDIGNSSAMDAVWAIRYSQNTFMVTFVFFISKLRLQTIDEN